jgi:ceramide glucosyltransferase
LNLALEITAVITGASMAYCLVCIWAAVRFVSRSKPSLAELPSLPPVSILKPLKGTDPEMYESLRSHCLQDYPAYEILFGIGDGDDPAAAIVKQLRREFPKCPIGLIQCESNLGANGKVSSLAQLADAAKYDCLLVNDSDIRVEPNYLRIVIGELHQNNTGLVTCLYRGVPARTLASRLESLGISADFVPGVLVARQIERGLHFGLGSTLAFRRQDLQAIGGFAAIADYLADDYELGRHIARLGRELVLSKAIVETFLPAYSWSDFFSHQLRWARTIHASRPAGYSGLVLTYTLAWAILSVVLARGARWAWLWLAGAILLRAVVAIVTGIPLLGDKQITRSLWLLPLRDILAPVVWLGGLFGRTIIWRGEQFELHHGKLKRAADSGA